MWYQVGAVTAMNLKSVPHRAGSSAVTIVGIGGVVVVLVAVLILLVRRTLTPQRALACSGMLILSALFSYRDFISDPVGAVLGFSGAALVLFGLTWDLLTGSGWANQESRRFPRPTRVLLVLTN